jgi:sarcosine oxidase subunit beta
MRYSVFSLARNALSYHQNWPRLWREPPLKSRYAVVIVGAGGHGLATAYYLAKRHGIADVAVIEKGWLGGGNTGRNTITIRANYLREPMIRLCDASIRLWEELSRELNYNVMFSQRGQVDLIQQWAKLRDVKRRQAIMNLHGIAFEIISRQRAKEIVPILDLEGEKRLPVLAASWHPTAGVARHDAVAWGYARGADALGVDIVQNCEVTAIRRESGRTIGVDTARGFVAADKVVLAVAGHAGVLAATVGFRLPIETVPLQAFVSEPLKPMLDVVVNIPALHTYLCQSDKGELVIGGGADPVPGYVQRGSFAVIEKSVSALVEMFPVLRTVRLLRHWAGLVDLCYDTSPIVSKAPVDGLYMSVGWGSGGFKTIPIGGVMLADLVARDAPHDMIAPYALSRFVNGRPSFETAGASTRE